MRPVVADASVMLNLVASGCAAEILSAVGTTLVMPRQVAEEVRFIYERDADGGEWIRVGVDLPALVAADVLAFEEPGDVTWVRCVSAGLTDRDALVVALVIDRQLELATDDAKVRRVAAALQRGLVVHGTLGWLHAACEVLGWDSAVSQAVCRNVRWRGRFLPPRADPLAAWFQAMQCRG